MLDVTAKSPPYQKIVPEPNESLSFLLHTDRAESSHPQKSFPDFVCAAASYREQKHAPDFVSSAASPNQQKAVSDFVGSDFVGSAASYREEKAVPDHYCSAGPYREQKHVPDFVSSAASPNKHKSVPDFVGSDFFNGLTGEEATAFLLSVYDEEDPAYREQKAAVWERPAC